MWPMGMRKEAEQLRRRGGTHESIAAQLTARIREWGLDSETAGEIPPETVRTWTKGIPRGAGPDHRWDMWAATDDERRRVVPVMAWLVHHADAPEARWMTAVEAEWVYRVATMLRPDEDPGIVWSVAWAAARMDGANDRDGLRELDLELVLYAAHPDANADAAILWWRDLGASQWVQRAHRVYFMTEPADDGQLSRVVPTGHEDQLALDNADVG
jgi:hypothetical protein